jgi:rare lipoprotein A
MTTGSTTQRGTTAGPARVLSWGLVVLLAGYTTASSARPTSPQRVKKHKAQEGIASWYGPGFHGRPTASGEIYDMHALTAAHRTLPLGTMIEVRNLENGRTTTARINDRGPHRRGRIVDLSLAAAQVLGIDQAGTAKVRLTVLAAPEAEAAMRYWVQVGAFQQEENARALLGDLERRYPGTEIRVESGWFQVRVPSGEKKRRAEALRRDLGREGFETLLVRQPKSKR